MPGKRDVSWVFQWDVGFGAFLMRIWGRKALDGVFLVFPGSFGNFGMDRSIHRSIQNRGFARKYRSLAHFGNCRPKEYF